LADLIDAKTESKQRSNDRSHATAGHVVKVIREDQLRIVGQLAQFHLNVGEDLYGNDSTDPATVASQQLFGSWSLQFLSKIHSVLNEAGSDLSQWPRKHDAEYGHYGEGGQYVVS
jgi:hypothetical protein